MKAISDLHPLLVVSPSKALLHLFTKMRRLDTDSETFVKYSKRAMRILAEDAIAELPNVKVVKDVQTPCGTVEGAELVEPSSVCAISIIRSGDALLEGMSHRNDYNILRDQPTNQSTNRVLYPFLTQRPIFSGS